MSAARAWMDEAYLRLEDAEILHERERHARAVSACYYAVRAAGKGALKAEGVGISSHKAFRVHLAKEFIRRGYLPDDTDAFVDEVYKRRLRADYELAEFSVGTTSDVIAAVLERLNQFAALLKKKE